MPLTVQNVYGLLLRSKLLPANDAKALYERWQREAKDYAGDVERFRRWMVGHRYLTDYQATLLCKGHTDGFYISVYKVLDRLGRGRMAGVYKAVHPSGQVVAIKVLPPSKAKVPYLLSRFEREAKLACQLKHPNIVRSFHHGQSDGLNYIVMEYLEGETLEDVLNRRRRLPPAEAARLMYQILQGLQHIHDKNMVHRDLKPSNMMIVPPRVPGQPDNTLNAVIKILDIGLGRMFFDETMPAVERDDQLTGEGVLLGTPDYLAPEQARNARGVDIRADIYSLGCVLYHCISGQPPYPDTNILNQIIRHARETPPPLKQFNPDMPDGLQQVINCMMAKDFNQRYPTPIQASQALLPYLGSLPEPPRVVEDPPMTQYLIWLENRLSSPAAGTNPSPTSKSSHSGRSHRHSKHGLHRKKKKKHREPGTVPAAMAGQFDVELVPVGPASSSKHQPSQAKRKPGMGRRDLLILGLGAGAVLAAVAVGGTIAYLTRDRNDPPPAEEK